MHDITVAMIKNTNMGNDDGGKQESTGDSLSSTSDIPKPIWVRYFSLQTDTINQRLLEHNVRAIFIGIPIIVFVLLVI